MATDVKVYAPGTFCWTDLSTPNPASAIRFYTRLMGWTAQDNPVGKGDVYTMLKQDGRDVGALFTQPEDQKEMGVPPHWGCYVSVTSADDAARKAAELGGRVVAPPFDVMDVGRMAVIADPTGAIFSVWEARRHHGAGVVGEPGSMCWNELMTADVVTARKFYEGMFGWTSRMEKMGDGGAYTVFMNKEQHAGGMMAWTQTPPAWLVYFAVRDCDAIAVRVPELGGRVLSPPTDIPKVGRFAVLGDPTGAVFAILAMPKP